MLVMPQTEANIFICMLDHVYEVTCANMKMGHQRWPEMPLLLGRSGTQYVAMVTKLLSLSCGAHLVESYCKNQTFLIQIGWDTLFIIFDQNLVECMMSSIG